MVAEEDQEHQELEVDPEHKDHKDPEELKVCMETGLILHKGSFQ